MVWNHPLHALYVLILPEFESNNWQGESQKKEHPKEHGQNLQASFNKSSEFYFCRNITTNLFYGGSVIKEVVFPNGISIAQVPTSSSW